MSTTTQKYSVSITSIVCEATADAAGFNDEVFVIWQADGGVPVRYPASHWQNMNSTPSSDAVSTWNIPEGDLHLVFEKEVLVTLWDSQHSFHPSSAVYLMSYEYTAPDIDPDYPGTETSYTMSNNNGATYTINASAVTQETVTTDNALQAEVRPHLATIKKLLERSAPRAAGSGAPNVVPEDEARSIRVLAEVLEAWRSSPEGAARLQAMRGLDLKGIHAELDSIVKGPYFAGALQLAASKGQIDLSGFQSFSLGAAGIADFELGVYGSIGYVCDMSVVTGGSGTTGIYITAAMAEVTGGALAGVAEVGVWKPAMKDLGGRSSAVIVDLGDVEEDVIFLRFESDGNTEGYVVGYGAGAGAELGDLDPAYTFLFTMTSNYPVMQEDASNCLILTKLECLNKLAKDGHDEVTLYITADAPSGSTTTYRYPTWDDFAMADDSDDFNIWYPGRSVMFNNSVTVEASDSGTTLASFTLSLGDFSGVGDAYTPQPSNITYGLQDVSYQLTALLITKGS